MNTVLSDPLLLLQKAVEERHKLFYGPVKVVALEDEQKKVVAYREERSILCQGKVTVRQTQRFDFDTSKRNLLTGRQERQKTMETGLQQKGKTTAFSQIMQTHGESLNVLNENIETELQDKERSIKQACQPTDATNKNIVGFAGQINDLQRKLEVSQKENQELQKIIEAENKKVEDLVAEVEHLKRKCIDAKNKVEREHRNTERMQLISSTKILELKGKLEAAELRIMYNK